jgi:hypothetical protein
MKMFLWSKWVSRRVQNLILAGYNQRQWEILLLGSFVFKHFHEIPTGIDYKQLQVILQVRSWNVTRAQRFGLSFMST